MLELIENMRGAFQLTVMDWEEERKTTAETKAQSEVERTTLKDNLQSLQATHDRLKVELESLYEVAGKYREGSTSLEASTLRAENKTTLLSQDMDSMAEGPEDGDQAGAIYLESCFKVTDIAHRQEMEALSVRPLAPHTVHACVHG